jgi:hypothetical protein
MLCLSGLAVAAKRLWIVNPEPFAILFLRQHGWTPPDTPRVYTSHDNLSTRTGSLQE